MAINPIPPPQIDEINLDTEGVKFLDDRLSDEYALTLVKRTFGDYEVWRNQNHDWRWRIHDQLYYGVVPQKVWEGTNIARSNLGIPYTFEQIETAMPQIMEALFGYDDWFSITPEPGGQLEEARAVQAHLKYVFAHGKNDFSQTAEQEFETAIRASLLYGAGPIMLDWDTILDRPIITAIDLRDLYVDPHTPSPNIEEARSVIYRRLMTVDEINALRSDPRMKIPDNNTLIYMSRNRFNTIGDETKRAQEAARKVQYTPGFHDTVPLPAGNFIEVLIYYDKGRIIWTFDRSWIAFQGPNPYGFYPFCVAPCFSVPYRFYSQAFSDIVEGPQQYAQALINARLDELSLLVFPPRYVKRSGGPMPPSKSRIRPGMTIETSEEPQKSVLIQQGANATQNVFDEINYLNTIKESLTGVNSMAVGVPRPGNVNRTAQGVNSQINATVTRMQLLVRHYEQFLVMPVLYKSYRMIQKNGKTGKLLPALGQNDQYFNVGQEAFNSPVRIKVNAASRMMNKEKLASVLPIIEGGLLNPNMLQSLNSVGWTIDPLELMQLVQDAAGTKEMYKLVRPLNQQEQQARQQPSPDAQLKSQQSQQEVQTRLQLGSIKADSERYKADREYQAASEDSQERSARDMIKVIAQNIADFMGNNPAAKAQELEIKRREGEMKLAHQAQKHHMDMQQMAQKTQMGMQTEMAKHSLGLQTQAQKHQQQMAMAHQKAQTQVATQKYVAENKTKPVNKGNSNNASR